MLELFHVVYSADERFDATFRTNILVNSSGTCSYLPPGKSHILVTDRYWLGKKHFYLHSNTYWLKYENKNNNKWYVETTHRSCLSCQEQILAGHI